MMALSLDFSFNDLKNAIEKISFSVDSYRLLCRTKQLDISDETKFNSLRHLTKYHETIHVCAQVKRSHDLDEFLVN